MSKKPRVLFTTIRSDTNYSFAGTLPLAGCLPRSAATGYSQLEANYAQTGNKGNMAIGEATVRIFGVDRRFSCFLRLPQLLAIGWEVERIWAEIDRNFDLVVLITANGIRPEFEYTGLADILAGLNTPLVVLGLGMQRPLPPRLDVLPGQSQKFLKLVNQKALLFGVRGQETADWLAAVGLGNAQVLGCPSLYLYPDNFLAIKPPVLSASSQAVSAGYLDSSAARSKILCRLFHQQPGQCHYVMQSEFLGVAWAYEGSETLYNDATGQVNPAACQQVFGKRLDRTPPFSRYWYFQNMDAWRVFCAQNDYYLGDRLHGGIVAMQAGLPAIILWDDLRVREITALCAIPNRQITAITTERAGDLVENLLTAENIERFQETYRLRLARFDDLTGQCGLRRELALPCQKPPVNSKRQFLGKLQQATPRRVLGKLRRWLLEGNKEI